MDYSKPTLLVISGPNGAGKSTHVQIMLPTGLENIWSFDRDKTRTGFESQLANEGLSVKEIPLKSTRMMEENLLIEMRQAIAVKRHFVLETPLSHPDYWKYIDLFESNGYQIQLNYLCLDKIDNCKARVGQRVMEGGHFVNPSTIKGVYQKNLEYINEYRTTFAIIELYDGMGIPTLLARIEGSEVVYADDNVLKKIWVKQGLPLIAQDIKAFIKSKNIG